MEATLRSFDGWLDERLKETYKWKRNVVTSNDNSSVDLDTAYLRDTTDINITDDLKEETTKSVMIPDSVSEPSIENKTDGEYWQLTWTDDAPAVQMKQFNSKRDSVARILAESELELHNSAAIPGTSTAYVSIEDENNVYNAVGNEGILFFNHIDEDFWEFEDDDEDILYENPRSRTNSIAVVTSETEDGVRSFKFTNSDANKEDEMNCDTEIQNIPKPQNDENNINDETLIRPYRDDSDTEMLNLADEHHLLPAKKNVLLRKYVEQKKKAKIFIALFLTLLAVSFFAGLTLLVFWLLNRSGV